MKVITKFQSISGDYLDPQYLLTEEEVSPHILAVLSTVDTNIRFAFLKPGLVAFDMLATADFAGQPLVLVNHISFVNAHPTLIKSCAEHELVHCRDMQSGRLQFLPDTTTIWEGVEYKPYQFGETLTLEEVRDYTIASVDGTLPWETEALYVSLKHGSRHLIDSVSQEFHDWTVEMLTIKGFVL